MTMQQDSPMPGVVQPAPPAPAPPGPTPPEPAPDPHPGGDEPAGQTYLPDGTPMTFGRGQTGAAGQTLFGDTVEMGGAGVTRTLSPKPPEKPEAGPNLFDRWLDSAVAKRFGTAIARGPLDLGLMGKGDLVVGHMILMDVDSGELVRVLPGTRLEDDKVYVNSRNLPEWLVNDPELAKKA